MNCCAEAVITTSTAQPCSCNLRASSAALYAAMPPPTPSTTFMILFCVERNQTQGRITDRIVILDEAAAHFFHGCDSRLLGCAGQERTSAILQLACALGRDDDEPVCAQLRIV